MDKAFNLSQVVDVNGATDVGYTPPGPGAVPTTVAAALNAVQGVFARNFLYNGNFDAALNAGPIALPIHSDNYTAVDLWYTYQNTTSVSTAGQVTSTVAGFQHSLRIGQNSGSAGGNAIIALSLVKSVDAVALQGKNVVWSFYARAGTGFSGANLNIGLQTGTGIDEGPNIASWTGTVAQVSTTQVITTSDVLYTFTATIPADATEIAVRVFYAPNVAYGGNSLADDNVYLTGMKLEEGRIATVRDPVPFREYISVLRPLAPQHDYFGNFGASDPFSKCQLISRRGNLILINGNLEVIPPGSLFTSGGVQATYANCSLDKVLGQTLAANTLYHVYAYMLKGVMTLDFSTTGQAQDSYGVWTKSGDPTCTLVGLLQTDAAIHTRGVANAQTIISWNNRLRYYLSTNISGTTSSATWVELNSANRLLWVQWSDDLPMGPTAYIASSHSNAGGTCQFGIGFNSATTPTGPEAIHVVGGLTPTISTVARGINPGGTDMYVYATLLAQSPGGAGSLTINTTLAPQMFIDNLAV